MELKRERVREHLLTVIDGRRPGDAIPSSAPSARPWASRGPRSARPSTSWWRRACWCGSTAAACSSRPTRSRRSWSPSTGARARPEPGRLDEHGARPAYGTGRRPDRPEARGLPGGGAGARDPPPARRRRPDRPGAPPRPRRPGPRPHRRRHGGRLLRHLRERRGIRTAHAVQSIEPTVLSEEEAALLDVPVLSPPCSSTGPPPTRPAAPSSTSAPSTAATATASSPASPWTPASPTTRPRGGRGVVGTVE